MRCVRLAKAKRKKNAELIPLMLRSELSCTFLFHLIIYNVLCLDPIYEIIRRNNEKHHLIPIVPLERATAYGLACVVSAFCRGEAQKNAELMPLMLLARR